MDFSSTRFSRLASPNLQVGVQHLVIKYVRINKGVVCSFDLEPRILTVSKVTFLIFKQILTLGMFQRPTANER